MAERILKKRKRLPQRLWFWTTLSVAVIIITVIFSANYIIGKVLEKSLVANGAHDASTGTIRFNPFAGSLSIDSLNVEQQSIDYLDIGSIKIRFRILALLRRSIEIKEVTIGDAHVFFTLKPDNRNISGTLRLPVPGESVGALDSSKWTLSLESFHVVNSLVRLNHGKDVIDLGIKKAEISGLDSLSETVSVETDLKATVNDSPVKVTFRIQSGNAEARLSGNIEIRDVEIEPFAGFLPFEAEILSGTLQVDTELNMTIIDSGEMRVINDGTITLSDVQATVNEMALEAGKITLQGALDLTSSQDSEPELTLDGGVQAYQVHVHTATDRADTGFEAMSWQGTAHVLSNAQNLVSQISGYLTIAGAHFADDSVKSGIGTMHWKGDIQFFSSSDHGMTPFINGDLTLVKVSVEGIGRQQSLIHVQSLDIPDLRIDDASDITVSGITGSRLEFFEEANDSLFTVNKLLMGTINVRDFNTIRVEQVGINKLLLKEGDVILGVQNTLIKGIDIDRFKQIAVAKLKIEGVAFEASDAEEQDISCSIEMIEADKTDLGEDNDLSVRLFALHAVDLRAGPHHLYLKSSYVRNAAMQRTDLMSASLFNIDSLVLLESTDKRVLQEVQSSFPFSLGRVQLMNVEVKEMKHLHIESALVGGLTAIFRRSSESPLSVGGMFIRKGDSSQEGGSAFTIDRISMLQNCNLIFIDETVDPTVQLDMKFIHFDVRGIDNTNTENPINFTSKIEIGPYADIATEGFIQRSVTPPNLDISLFVNGFGLQEMTPYVRKYLGYRIEKGQLSVDSHLALTEGEIKGTNRIVLKNTVMVAEEKEKSKEALSIYARSLDRSLKLLSDKNNTLIIDIPVSGSLNNPNFDMRKMVTAAVTKAIRTTIQLTLGIALWPYSGVFIAADLATESVPIAELEPVYFSAGKSTLSEGMQRYLNQVASLLDEHPQIDISLCSVGTEVDRSRFTSDARLSRLTEKRANAVKLYLVENAGIDPNRLFICLPEIDNTFDIPGYVELKI
jgi:hypothetical protein